jgi:hypothetical protein
MHEENTTVPTCWFRSCTFKQCKTHLKPNANQRDHFQSAFPLPTKPHLSSNRVKSNEVSDYDALSLTANKHQMRMQIHITGGYSFNSWSAVRPNSLLLRPTVPAPDNGLTNMKHRLTDN